MNTTKTRICPHCGEINMVDVQSVNHLLHLVMSVLTGGIWLAVWAVMMMSNDSDNFFKCYNCEKIFTAK